MKILYIHQYFKTPQEYGATRSYWISRELIANGHSVTMLSSHQKDFTKKKVERKQIDGIDVIYIKVPYDQKMGVFRRLWSFLSFMFKSTWIAYKEEKLDLVIVTSVPLTVGFPALVLKKVKRIPFIFEVRNLWPEVPIQMGALRNKLAQKMAFWFERTIYKNATHIITLSPGIFDGVVKQDIPQSKVSMIPNMSKIDYFWPRPPDSNLIAKFGLKQDSFKVAYFGAMGLANGMDYIIDAISYFKNDENIEFVFMGGGSIETSLQERCLGLDFKNTHFLGRLPMKELSENVNLCDVALVTYSNFPIFATHSPNKLFDALSAGKPIIVNSSGWTKDMVERHECGLFVDPKKPEDLANKIRHLKENPKLCEKMGLNARKLAETKYDKSILCREFADVIASISENISTRK
ncbi:glycosyltransferase family 4 protein [Winogradskyella sp.]|uniref:glycosyltransferase family 4 protein n=1 Tax=Winogradskyella sp. TaxID=1883156 RepID=UPI00262F8A3B|nr:glycosyltransferase family 4 protein [Winogradskyella sp.]